MPLDYFELEGRSAETEALRQKVKLSLEADVVKFFEESRGQVAIYDANVSPSVLDLLSLMYGLTRWIGIRMGRDPLGKHFERNLKRWESTSSLLVRLFLSLGIIR